VSRPEDSEMVEKFLTLRLSEYLELFEKFLEDGHTTYDISVSTLYHKYIC
jgi:hypothetical protein